MISVVGESNGQKGANCREVQRPLPLRPIPRQACKGGSRPDAQAYTPVKKTSETGIQITKKSWGGGKRKEVITPVA